MTRADMIKRLQPYYTLGTHPGEIHPGTLRVKDGYIVGRRVLGAVPQDKYTHYVTLAGGVVCGSQLTLGVA